MGGEIFCTSMGHLRYTICVNKESSTYGYSDGVLLWIERSLFLLANFKSYKLTYKMKVMLYTYIIIEKKIFFIIHMIICG